MRYLNAAEAGRALGIGDKTIRRWLKSGRFPSAIVKPNGEYAIPEADIDLLKQERNRYPSVGHDQSMTSDLVAKVARLEQTIAKQEHRIADLENIIAKLARGAPSESLDVAISRPVSGKTTRDTMLPSARPQRANVKANNAGLPQGCILASKFAKAHGVNERSFYDYMVIGLGPVGTVPWGMGNETAPEKDHVQYSERPKPNRPKEKERYLTADQQEDAIRFWKRHDVRFSQCDRPDCQCKK
jgi:predicted DNA-binding transcriptional regulator AlpA